MDYGYGGGGGYNSGGYDGYGGGGGGFSASQAAGSQSTPSGGRKNDASSIRPVTIKQFLDAMQPHPDSMAQISGVDVGLVTMVAQVRNVSKQATTHTLKLDDGTGTVEFKKWIDVEKPDTTPQVEEGEYVRVVGKYKTLNGRKHVAGVHLRPVTDHNEVLYHLLEATHVHLQLTRGPLNADGSAADVGIKAESGYGGGHGSYSGGGVGGGGGDVQMGGMDFQGLSRSAATVLQFLKTEGAENNDGVHLDQIAIRTGLSLPETIKAKQELYQAGKVYETVDENSIRAMDLGF